MLDPKIGRSRGIVVLCAIAFLQAIARLALGTVVAIGSGPGLDEPVSEFVNAFLVVMFLAIGGVSLATTYGLWIGASWGYVGTIAISLVTIVFDIWAVVFIQASAAMGIVLPLVFIVYLIVVMNRMTMKVDANESTDSIRD